MNATQTQLGKYQLLERLGQGGMAEVYRARQPMIERDVAIKILHGHLAESGDFVERFQREARGLGQLRHPHIVSVIDFDVERGQTTRAEENGDHRIVTDGRYYMVMDFIAGPTLADLIQQRGALPVVEALSIAEQIADALAYAHEQGTIHRDVKPGNIMFLDKDCHHAVLTDFGIARLLDDTGMTITGTMAGTPAYMSPEAGKGENVDIRSDLYSLGVLLYELVSGETPYKGETPVRVVMQHVTAPLPSVREHMPNLPDLVVQIIEKAMAKTPEERFQSAEAMRQALCQAQLVLNDRQIQSTLVAGRETLVEQPASRPSPYDLISNAEGKNDGETPNRQVVIPALEHLTQTGQSVSVGQTADRSITFMLTLAFLTLMVAAGWYFFAEEMLAKDATTAVTASESSGHLQILPVDDGQELRLSLQALVPLSAEQHYHAWIKTTDNRLFDLGTLTMNNGDAIQQLVAPYNVLALLDTVLISLEEIPQPIGPSVTVVASGQLTTDRARALMQLWIESSTVLGKPLLPATDEQIVIAQTHNNMLHDGIASNDLTAVQQHAEHIVNTLVGESDDRFGDLNGDGQAQNPGDGVGVQVYLATIDEALAALNADQRAVARARTAAMAAITIARQITAADTLDEANHLAAELSAHLTELLTGTDLDGSGAIEPDRGEGAFVALTESVATLSVVSLQRSPTQSPE